MNQAIDTEGTGLRSLWVIGHRVTPLIVGGRVAALEVAHRAGVVGCADGLPADLSTNRHQFEGFGR